MRLACYAQENPGIKRPCRVWDKWQREARGFANFLAQKEDLYGHRIKFFPSTFSIKHPKRFTIWYRKTNRESLIWPNQDNFPCRTLISNKLQILLFAKEAHGNGKLTLFLYVRQIQQITVETLEKCIPVHRHEISFRKKYKVVSTGPSKSYISIQNRVFVYVS